MSPKEIFSQNKALSDQLSAVVNANWFGECLIYAHAILMDGKLTTEELEGAKKFRDALLSLADSPEASHPPLTSGIKHDLSIPVRTSYPTNQPKS